MRLTVFLMGALLSLAAVAQDKWVTSWAASVQGPYPVGNPSAQPKLDVVFPAPESGARDQSFLIARGPLAEVVEVGLEALERVDQLLVLDAERLELDLFGRLFRLSNRLLQSLFGVVLWLLDGH